MECEGRARSLGNGRAGATGNVPSVPEFIGDGDDRGEVDDGTRGRGIRVVARNDEALESAEKGGEAGAAAESDDVETAGDFAIAFFHGISEGPGLRAKTSAGGAVFFRVEQFGEARIFLQEREIFIVARVIAVRGAEFDCDLQIRKRGIGLAGEAIERGERVDNVIRFRRGFAGAVKTFARFIPTAKIHHGHAALIVIFGGFGTLLLRRLHALFGDPDMHACAIGEFLAGAFQNFFQLLLGFGKLLLVEEGEGFVVRLELGLDEGIDHLDTAALRRMSG